MTKNSKLKSVTSFLGRNTIVPILIVAIAAAAIFVPNFFRVQNLINIFNQNAMKGVMAIGMTFVIINGYFDMSVCTSVGLTAAIVCKMQNSVGLVPAILVALAVGIVIGAINGLLVSRVKINAFVVTLAMMLGCRGVAYIYHAESSIVASSAAFKTFGIAKVGMISYISILLLVLLVIAHYVLRYTKHGRNTYAAGGNENAAFNAGINVQNTILINFIICGFTGALGGILYAANFGASTPALGWPDIHMLVIAAVVLGGSKLSGGKGNIWYTLGGVYILGMIDNVMNLLNVQTYIKTMITGLIMIAILYMDKVLSERRSAQKQ